VGPFGRDSTWLATLSVYAGAILLGLTLVSFPASSAFLRARHGFSDVAYGSIYLPQLVAAIAGALLGGVAMRRVSLRTMYLVALVCFVLSQLSLALSVTVSAHLALLLLMFATSCFGFGFGFGGGPLNAFVPLLFPKRANAAIVTLHMSAGAGLTIGPYVIGALTAHHYWIVSPVCLAICASLLWALTLFANLPAPSVVTTSIWPAPARTVLFWLVALMAMLYSVAEAMFSNWAVLYVTEERRLPIQVATLALTCFWGSLTLGRLLVSLALAQIRPVVLLGLLPTLMAIAFIAASRIDSSYGALLAFAFAGFACSGVFPLLVGYASGPFPNQVSWIAAMLTAAMMVGVGIGSYAIGALRDSFPITILYRYSIVYPLAIIILLALTHARGGSMDRADGQKALISQLKRDRADADAQ
jgi:predicted MFS family arabinose efflux permease